MSDNGIHQYRRNPTGGPSIMQCGMISRGSSWSRPALVMVLYLGMGAAALGWTSLRGQSSLWQIAGRQDPRVFTGIVLGLLFGLAIVFASRMAFYKFEWARALHRDFRALLSPLGDREIIVLALASSIGEEMFFRGALIPVVGLVGSSAVFALLHIAPRARHLPWTISSFIAGLIFGQLYLWTGDLTGAVVAHFTVNFLNLRHVAHYDLR
jgi:membrane protease YdiL (CAAX protease family)